MCAAVHRNIQALSGLDHVSPVLLMYKSTFDYPYTRRCDASYRYSERITLHIPPQSEISLNGLLGYRWHLKAPDAGEGLIFIPEL
jgi:hypothetical protein